MTLRELAEAATPGPWESNHQGLYHSGGSLGMTDYDGVDDAEADATYIAAVDPQTVIALLDRIDELERAAASGVPDPEDESWVCHCPVHGPSTVTE